MRKLILIVSLLFFAFSQAQIINPSNVNLIEIVVGGGVSSLDPDAVEVDSQSDLSAVGSQNKNLYITTDITLTGNVSVASGATLIGLGGVITLGSNTITFQNNGFKSINYQTFINVGSSGVISDSSTFKDELGSYSLNWFGLVNDGDADANTGTDNRNILKQAEKVGRYSGASMSIDIAGDYVYSPLDYEQTEDYPDNFVLTGTSSLYLAKDVTLGILTSTTNSYAVLEIWDAHNIRVYGQGQIKGDFFTRDFATYGDQDGHGVMVKQNSDHVYIEVPVSQVAADCIIARYNPNFVHLNSLVEAAFTKNFYIDDTGSFVASNDFAYSNLFSLTNTSFADNGGFVFGGGSFSGTFGMKGSQYRAAFYTAGGTFISLSDLLEIYEKVPIPDTATQVRVVISTPDVWGDLNGSIYAPTTSSHIYVKSPFLKYGPRQGISNLHPYSVIDGVTFDLNGRQADGTTVPPGYNFDSEDGYQNLRYVEVKNSIWRNGKGGDIILKGAWHFNIHDNHFAYNNVPEWVNVNSISLNNGHNTRFYNNWVQDRTFGMGREDYVYDNTFEDSMIEFSYEKSVFHDNKGFNVKDFNSAIDEDVDGYTTIKNNIFRYDKPLDATTYIFREHSQVRWIDNEFIFDDLVMSNSNRVANLSAVPNNEGIPLGYIDGMKVEGLKGNTLSSDGWQTYAWNMDNMDFSCSIDVRRGATHDWYIKDTNITGWLYLNLTDYPTTNGGNSSLYDTTTLDDVNITIDDSGLISGTAYAFRVSADDVNVVWNGGEIDMQVASNRFMDLNHYGTTTFNNVTFIATSAQTIDLTTLASGDDVIFNNCTFINVTVTLRAGDQNNNPTNL
tara:strand:+ start:278 stop:2797 length:2520 start_codon:yes stop_codon:yes gene_type:complete